MLTEISLPMTLRPSRRKWVVMMVLCLAFVGLGVWIAETKPLIGYVCAVFFGLGGLICLIPLVTGSPALKLTEEGFEVDTIFRKVLTRWEDVHVFFVTFIGPNKFVAMDHSPGYDLHEKSRALAKSMAGVEGILPDTFGMKAEDLAGLMNAIKDWVERDGEEEAHEEECEQSRNG